jgi:hypothetical protein
VRRGRADLHTSASAHLVLRYTSPLRLCTVIQRRTQTVGRRGRSLEGDCRHVMSAGPREHVFVRAGDAGSLVYGFRLHSGVRAHLLSSAPDSVTRARAHWSLSRPYLRPPCAGLEFVGGPTSKMMLTGRLPVAGRRYTPASPGAMSVAPHIPGVDVSAKYGAASGAVVCGALEGPRSGYVPDFLGARGCTAAQRNKDSLSSSPDYDGDEQRLWRRS